MNADLFTSIALVLAGGILNGSFVAPIKKTTGWRWENAWLIYTLSGLLVIPWIAAWLWVPQLGQVFASAPVEVIWRVIWLGFGWGVGSVLFGLGVDRMGLAVGYGLILGLIAPIGTFIPLIVLSPERLQTKEGRALMLGTAIVIGGIILCARAGRIREANSGVPPKSTFGLGLLICVLAGIFSPFLNFAFAFGDGLTQTAARLGASPLDAPNAVWALTLTGGTITNAGYAIWLLNRNRTWGHFSSGPANHWGWACLMGLLCFGSFLVYGYGATGLGKLGAVVGWPLFMSAALITSNLLGALSGEWKGAPRQAWYLSMGGIGLLIVAIVVIALGREG
jgi:L-rhamnose-H+ transport protein